MSLRFYYYVRCLVVIRVRYIISSIIIIMFGLSSHYHLSSPPYDDLLQQQGMEKVFCAVMVK